MKSFGFVLVLAVILLVIGCARSAAVAAPEPRPETGKQIISIAVQTFTPEPSDAVAAATASATEVLSATSTTSPTATNTATATPTFTPTAKPTLTPTATSTPAFGGYFRTIVLAKLPPAPPGPRTGEWWKNVMPTTAFEAGEDFCVVFNADKEVENVSYGIYNADSQTYAKDKTLFSQNGRISRGHTGCLGKAQFTKGNYEFRVWVAENLIASLAFEVKSEMPTPTPPPIATRMPQPIIPPPAPPAPAPAGPLQIPPTGFAIPVSAMTNEVEVAQGAENHVRGIFAYKVQADEPNFIISIRIYNVSRENITGITLQDCLINGEYSNCLKPTSSTFSAGDPIRAILVDTNHTPSLMDAEFKKHDINNWTVKVKILSIVISSPK